ncbi:hypothetical protein [Nicoliella lavandulae]|uniref:Uncharacterized protein n=1 Tax=Nicoliella lavandulae TaxID=3082954 RepID=A0ABU8SPG8_9LACO
MDYEKYIEALKHETPDTVFGSLMDDLNYPKVDSIGDACDVAHFTNDQHDLDEIEKYQPMFYNYKYHRLVSKNDVINYINQLSK